MQARSFRSFQRVGEYQDDKESLEMHPVSSSQPHGTIPNTPAMVSLISFLLGGLCFTFLSVFLKTSLSNVWDGSCIESRWYFITPQLAFFVAAWGAFHWGEFMVTAQWNREKCSIDCKPVSSPEHTQSMLNSHFFNQAFLLDNGMQYHIAHGTALAEYILSLYFRPSWKTFPYISAIGSPISPIRA